MKLTPFITNKDYIAVWAICRPLITGIAMSILKLFKKVWTFHNHQVLFV